MLITRPVSRRAEPKEVAAAIGGFVLINDFSARDTQADELTLTNPNPNPNPNPNRNRNPNPSPNPNPNPDAGGRAALRRLRLR